MTKVTLLGFKEIESKPEEKNKSNLPTIDCTDLIGTYTMDQMPDLLKKIDEKIKKVKNQGLVFIRDIEISERLKNNLLRNDFETLQDVSTQTTTQILTLDGMGLKCYRELCTILNTHGLQLKSLEDVIFPGRKSTSKS